MLECREAGMLGSQKARKLECQEAWKPEGWEAGKPEDREAIIRKGPEAKMIHYTLYFTIFKRFAPMFF